MANYTTTDDLKADALNRAGEPTDGSSDWETLVVTYLNAAQLGLLLGGPLGPQDESGLALPIIDWWWARKVPNGVFNTVGEITTGTVTATKGSTTITFSSAPASSVTGYRIRINSLSPVPRIASHTGGQVNATLDAAWPEDTQTTVTYKLFKIEYDLAADFLRFAGNPRVTQYPYRVEVIDPDVMEDNYPISMIAAGTVDRMALIGPQTVQLNYWTEDVERIEYPYIYAPADLAVGVSQSPVLPRHHRRILSTAAAGLICFDKSDDKAAALVREASVLLRAMLQEHYHHMRRGSKSFAAIKTRSDADSPTGPMRTESGLIIG